jgi:hypothetical protein
VAVRRTAGWGVVQRVIDQCQYTFEVFIDIVVPKAQDLESLLGEMIVTFCVTPRMRIDVMLTAIDFDDEPMFEADKIDDKTVTRRLTTKVKPSPSP